MSKHTHLLVLLVAIAFVLAGCHDPDPADDDPTNGEPGTDGEEPAQEYDVTMESIEFNPPNITIEVGSTVTWTNEDPVEHTTTADNGEWDSGLMAQGDTFNHTFEEAGTFTYHCIPHQSQGMTGTIIVE